MAGGTQDGIVILIVLDLLSLTRRVSLAFNRQAMGPAWRWSDVMVMVAGCSGAMLVQAQNMTPVPAASAASSATIIEAHVLQGVSGVRAQASGDVEIRQGDIVLKADEVDYKIPDKEVTARGQVSVRNGESTVIGDSARLKLDTYEGEVLNPHYTMTQKNASGRADRVVFLDRQRSRWFEATYTTCRREDYPTTVNLPWELSSREVKLDYQANEGLARGAVLRFYGVPILAVPAMTFPLSDERKSGWLPPRVEFDTRGGFGVSAPWYWNIAPNQDATFTPIVATKRGVGLAGEYRYLLTDHHGEVSVHTNPNDAVVHRDRWSMLWRHQTQLNEDITIDARWQRASDGDYWKDFSRFLDSSTPRLLSSQINARWYPEWGHQQVQAYANLQHWQVLQDSSALIAPPYRRVPQVGMVTSGAWNQWRWSWLNEANRFQNPDVSRINGSRLHSKLQVGRTLGADAYTVTPEVLLQATAYQTDQPMSNGRDTASRWIPTFKLNQSVMLEREARLFRRDVTQTLEPRLQYVYTPYREQRHLPLFDTAVQDFNFATVYDENIFAGSDRIADANQLTGGVTSRFIDRQTGAENLRLGLVQRVLFHDQRITPNDGPPLTQRWSDLLLLGSTTVIPHWTVDGSWQYSPEINGTKRSTLSARYSPGPYRTVSVTHRYTRDSAEQLDAGWQWPVWGPAAKRGQSDAGACQGSWYSLGRVNYSLKERKITDTLMGLEYESNCWTARLYVSRLSTNRTQAVTGLGFELEFVGLSKLPLIGSMKALSDNIPGYQPLSGSQKTASSFTSIAP